MAHVHEHSLKIKLSKLMKGDPQADDCQESCLVAPEVIAGIEDVVRELIGDPNIVVEITQDS